MPTRRLTARLIALGLLAAAPLAPAHAQPSDRLSDAERVILDEVLDQVLGTDEAAEDDEATDTGKGKGEKDKGDKGKGAKGLPPGLAKRDSLPPGLANRDSLPPGLAKRLDDRLEEKLRGRDVEVGEDGIVIIRDEATGAIVDVLKDVLSGGRAGQ